MADGFTVDFSDLNKLAADLASAPERAVPKIRKAVEVTARNVKEDWRKPLQGSATVPGGAASISYDMELDGDGIGAEIGPELKGQGPIVGMLEYGTPTTGPTGYGHAALQQNEADFEKGLSIALSDVL